ncbi:MAG: glycosyltransferase family 2 protein [Calothrix sp. SM1_7_51]|nr:glycosyltransferase family 2 protein [Calothrix sp. SM1_7_51]
MSISVCMAVYNGQKYLETQISSILTQLGDSDEVIVIDDCSIDNSINIINKFQDSRIKLIKNEINLGVVNTFQKALMNASGEIIFLSDQDDIWLFGKVKNFIEVFQSRPDITLVLSDAQIIDSQGQLAEKTFFQLRGKFTPDCFSNLIKNKYHGCTLAFRKELLEFILPFPSDTPMHDMWIGVVNSIYGKAVYIEKPLMQHRRHNTNTGRGISNHSGLLQMIRWRFALVKNIAILTLKKKAFIKFKI